MVSTNLFRVCVLVALWLVQTYFGGGRALLHCHFDIRMQGYPSESYIQILSLKCLYSSGVIVKHTV